MLNRAILGNGASCLIRVRQVTVASHFRLLQLCRTINPVFQGTARRVIEAWEAVFQSPEPGPWCIFSLGLLRWQRVLQLEGRGGQKGPRRSPAQLCEAGSTGPPGMSEGHCRAQSWTGLESRGVTMALLPGSATDFVKRSRGREK